MQRHDHDFHLGADAEFTSLADRKLAAWAFSIGVRLPVDGLQRNGQPRRAHRAMLPDVHPHIVKAGGAGGSPLAASFLGAVRRLLGRPPDTTVAGAFRGAVGESRRKH
ncbi:hypothetical protein [Aquamicrobium sp. LC103]|uniref:hypothetical protein n=1 Tax=Aquamicrobium sp. LC103 TaxID=1120658 RepID=UPI00063E8A8F|nr:hypothetical protein [Aquamicrobium sp. LC103]TKT77351.1 hypothetical protein XW59_012805 [Aquamicrobium sp. LC103]